MIRPIAHRSLPPTHANMADRRNQPMTARALLTSYGRRRCRHRRINNRRAARSQWARAVQVERARCPYRRPFFCARFSLRPLNSLARTTRRYRQKQPESAKP